MLTNGCDGNRTQVVSIDCDAAVVWIRQAEQQGHERRFACSRGTDDSCYGSQGSVERYVLQHRPRGIVAVCHRVERYTVLDAGHGPGVGRVLYVRLEVEYLKDAAEPHGHVLGPAPDRYQRFDGTEAFVGASGHHVERPVVPNRIAIAQQDPLGKCGGIGIG